MTPEQLKDEIEQRLRFGRIAFVDSPYGLKIQWYGEVFGQTVTFGIAYGDFHYHRMAPDLIPVEIVDRINRMFLDFISTKMRPFGDPLPTVPNLADERSYPESYYAMP